MRKISANPSHRASAHVGRERLSDTGLATSISQIPQAIDQSPKSQLHTQGRTSRWDSMTAWIVCFFGGFFALMNRWPDLTQRHSFALLGYKYGHKVHTYTKTWFLSVRYTGDRESSAQSVYSVLCKWSICETVFWLYKYALDAICSESCSLNSVNLQC